MEYRCSACRKAIKTDVVQCKSCIKLFYHPGCVNKHRVYDRNNELVQCNGPFEKFMIDNEHGEVKKTAATNRDGLGAAVAAGKLVSGSTNMDIRIDWLVRTVKEIKDESICKKEIKVMIKEIIQLELKDIKEELEEVRRMLSTGPSSSSRRAQKSYSEIVKEKKKENIIIVKPKVQQENVDTAMLIKKKVDIKNMEMGVTKIRKGNNGTVILGCETGEEMAKLKTTVQSKLGDNFKVMESLQMKPKLKIVYIDEEEWKLSDEELIDTIKKQNKFGLREESNIKIIKRLKTQTNRRGRTEGTIIIEVDERTHELMLKQGKVNIGWKRCPVFNHISVKRCFKCWGYRHIVKNCIRDVACHKCAGNHNSNECTTNEKKCINCKYKNQSYNLKIKDDHDALSPECPTFKRVLQEEKRRAGWEDIK